MTSSSVLKTSESKLFNAGSTIKIGHFLDDMKSSEIKVPFPEISENLENVNFLHQQISLFEGKSAKINLIILDNGSELKAYQASVNYVQLKFELLSRSQFKSSAFKTNQISTLQFEAFCHSKTENS